MALRPTSSWWVLVVGKTRGKKNKGRVGRKEEGRRGGGVKGSSGGLPTLLQPSQPRAPHLGVRKGSRAAHELQECELTHRFFYSPIYHLLISLAQMSGGDLWPYRLGAHNLQRRIGKAHEAQKWLKGRGRSLEKAWPEESAGQASGAE